MKEFDLNTEKILENWEPAHAVREVIANALDEQVLTGTRDIEIQKAGSVWHIRDYGRGLHYRHLTQNENEEKLRHERLIGKFGVGLKDALATFYRHGIFVEIRSRYGTITLTQTPKAGFADIVTLHALVSAVERPDMVGTDVLLYRCPDEAIQKAKMQFLRFTDAVVLEETRFGQVIRREAPDHACIYVNGVEVAKEPDFLFSYNITSMTRQLRNALNRERTNVGRSAYSDRVKTVLLACTSEEVIRPLVEDLHHYGAGTRHDELSWNDVMLFAARQAARMEKNAVFLSPAELMRDPALVDEMTVNLPGTSPRASGEISRNRPPQKLPGGY